MKIKRLYINNYKSLVDFELVEPNSFSVFVGPNAAGKSNIFEALEFLTFTNDFVRMDSLFGGANNYLNKNLQKDTNAEKNNSLTLTIKAEMGYGGYISEIEFIKKDDHFLPVYMDDKNRNGRTKLSNIVREGEPLEQWFNRIFSRLFINNEDLVKIQIKTPHKLALDANNLAQVLKKVLKNEISRDEILEWMEELIPEFEHLEIKSDPISGESQLFIKEKYTGQYFPKNMLSNGTYNILTLLTAVYQSDEPQFLCIEEPENGLTPYVIRELVGFFRQLCEEKGHYIWLNTHSSFLVRQLLPREMILVDKKEGITRAKQIDKDLNFRTMKMDEAWLSNALGGGLPW